ncbi:hypothetical protein AB840_05710 [Megasphaera cerevisiae DSM 20462]|uniref:Uncharacterized protein n=1 Tax=Megasphaera cerevisiae DSM 20462 TaxID=1122219 RepID=A0A0J6WXF2_9FIRM|nr:hypothetical protein [Megasphaera cerevisiae]KMO86913.1 hypothetical protein AB840_05710 [Megasphaera cerevisiae DSM 20462]SJZ79387.1 hypothetical protein SAMN05660900_01462 [Megasphaera cerevisiae DSM 20462]
MNYTAARMPHRAGYTGLPWAVALWLMDPVIAAESPMGRDNDLVTPRDVVPVKYQNWVDI